MVARPLYVGGSGAAVAVVVGVGVVGAHPTHSLNIGARKVRKILLCLGFSLKD